MQQGPNNVNAVIAEIRKAQDPANFLDDPLDPETILHAASQCGAGHALVYLVATPWGGVAVVAVSANTHLNTRGYFATIDLPRLTDTLIRRSSRQDSMGTAIHGRSSAVLVTPRSGNGFPVLSEWWPGETLRERTEALQRACIATGKRSTFAEAAQAVMSIPELMGLADKHRDALSENEYALCSATFEHLFLRQELQKTLETLATEIIHPLVAWLGEHEVPSIPLIPCGWLAAFRYQQCHSLMGALWVKCYQRVQPHCSVIATRSLQYWTTDGSICAR